MKSRMKLANEDINRELSSMEEEHKKKEVGTCLRFCFVSFFFIENDNLAPKKKEQKDNGKKIMLGES